jgi:hypothetical protein
VRLLAQLLDRAVDALPADLHDRVVIFGSAPMVFAGLKPDVTFDLDLFVSDETYQTLLDAGFEQDLDERGLPRIMAAEAVEVVSVWPGVAFEEAFAAAAVEGGSRGMRVASLEHVLAFKANSPRVKDQTEAGTIRKALAEPRARAPR